MQADLATGEGWEQAVKDVDTIVHAASAGFGDPKRTDISPTSPECPGAYAEKRHWPARSPMIVNRPRSSVVAV